VAELRQQLAALQLVESCLQAKATELSADKHELVSANQQLQQALMDKAVEAANSGNLLRQQHASQLADMRQEQQQILQRLQKDAGDMVEQHKQVGVSIRPKLALGQAALRLQAAVCGAGGCNCKQHLLYQQQPTGDRSLHC
jgi:DNA mismatch repair ATPase MutS